MRLLVERAPEARHVDPADLLSILLEVRAREVLLVLEEDVVVAPELLGAALEALDHPRKRRWHMRSPFGERHAPTLGKPCAEGLHQLGALHRQFTNALARS